MEISKAKAVKYFFKLEFFSFGQNDRSYSIINILNLQNVPILILTSFIVRFDIDKYIIMQQIKDQQRLFEKLFISPNLSSPNPHLILSMQFLKLLLEQARYLTYSSQKPFILKILGLFFIQPINSLLLYRHDCLAVDQVPLLSEIILTCAHIIKTKEESEQYISMLDSLLAYYPIGLIQISSITKQFALQFHQGKFQALRSRFLHKVLQKFYGPKRGLKGMPQSFFFMFCCSETSTIHSFEDMRIKIKNDIGFVFSFYMLDGPQKNVTICRVVTNREIIKVKVGKSICIQNDITKQTVIEQLENLQPETWYRIIINLTTSQTTIYLNEQQIVRERPLIKKQKDRDILEYSFGDEFYGFVTGLALTHKAIPHELVRKMPTFKNWSDATFIRIENIQEYFILSCFPFSTFQMRQSVHCFDIFQRIHSQIGENIILFRNYQEAGGVITMGGQQILLPLFYLARFYDPAQYPDQLACLLRIWLASLTLFPQNQRNQNFLLILGHHLQPLSPFLTSQCVFLLNQIYEKYATYSKISYLKHIAWSGLPTKSIDPHSMEWLNWLTKIYQNNKTQGLQAYGLLDVVYWLVIHLENNTQNCCPQHYLSESRVLRQFSFEEINKLQKINKRVHFQAAENIAAVILEYYIIDQHKNTFKDLRGIFRLLLHKYSICLYRTILRILKRQFPKFKDDRALANFYEEAGLLPFLAALAQKTVDTGLLALIVYLMLSISHFKQKSKEEIIDFLAIVLRRMQDFYHQNFNPVAHGAKKIRKSSGGSLQSQGYASIVQRIAQYKQDMKQLAVILINFCWGQVMDGQICKATKISGESQLYLLKSFMPVAGSDVRVYILTRLKEKLEQNPKNFEYCIRSIQFNEVLLCGLRDKKIKQFQIVKSIMVLLLNWQLSQDMQIRDYYTLIKTLAKSQIDMRQVLCQVFQEIITKNQQVTLQNLQMILFICVNQVKQNEAEQETNKGYTKLITCIGIKMGSLIKKGLRLDQSLQGTHILNRLKNLSVFQLDISLFNLEVNIIPQENINFLFDIFLPKAIAGYNIQSLFQQIRRRVYSVEIMTWLFLDFMKPNNEQRDVLAKQMIDVLKIYMSVSLVKSELQIDKSFMRMVLFLVSYQLCCLQLIHHFTDIWMWIIKLTKQMISQFKATSYSDLITKLGNQKILPYLVELFEIFLRPNNEEYLLPFQQMKSNTQENIVVFLNKILSHVVKSQPFALAYKKCRQYAYGQVINNFNQKIRTFRSKMDVKYKKASQQKVFRQVEKLFQEESVNEEETRLRYLHEHQCSLREYYSKWKKIWKRLRIYHHPYGLFMAQKDSPSSFSYKNIDFKNFRLKISKFSSNSGLQPILEAQVIQPWHVRKYMKKDGKNQLSSLVQMTRPTHNPRKRQEKITELATNFIRSLRGQKKFYQAAQYEVLWIKRGRKARGKLLISDQWQLVFWYDSLKQDDCHLSFQRFSLPFDKTMVKRWRVDLIKSINLKRYLMQWHALEIQLTYNKSLLFYFCDHRESHFLLQIRRMRNQRLQTIGSKLKLNYIPLYLEDWYCEGLPQNVTKNWLNRKISTLTYIMEVNKAGSRSILDISQYPVAPWVCEMSEQKQPTLRDLTKTMGALGSQERRKVVKQKYSANDPFNPVPPFFFGTHYSSPGVIFNYLIRIAPFTDYCKNLQGGKFDIADRLFASLITAWKSASSEVSDVRELIPEFFYLPEFLLNLENLHLGETQSGQTVNDVELPIWAGGNPYFFTVQLRQILQSEPVASNLPCWLNLIFGVKQRGKEAIQNFNVYYYLTYEEYSNCLQNKDDEVYRKSCEAQIIHFGQIPPQIFSETQTCRPIKFKEPTQLIVRQKIELMNALTQRPLGVAKLSHNQVMIVKRNEIQTLIYGKYPATMTKSVEFNLQKTNSKKLFNIKKQSSRLIFFGKYFLIYGYVTNQFKIFNKNSGLLEYDDMLDSKIETAIINQEQSLILLGCRSGLLHIYELEYQSSRLGCRKTMAIPFLHSVKHISQYDGFFAVSFGCYVSIYKIQRPLSYLSKDIKQPFIRFFRSFKNSLPVKGAFIADAPLYSLFLYDNAHVKVYSINGQFIKSVSCSPQTVQRMIDSQLNSLFCVQQEERLVLYSTPDLRCVSELQIKGAIQVSSGVVIYKKQLNFIDCGNI